MALDILFLLFGHGTAFMVSCLCASEFRSDLKKLDVLIGVFLKLGNFSDIELLWY